MFKIDLIIERFNHLKRFNHLQTRKMQLSICNSYFKYVIFLFVRYLRTYPASTQRCINVEIWLNIGHDVVHPYFNVDTTSKLQR